MRDVDIARRLLLALGPIRFIVFGKLPAGSRDMLRDAGSDVREQGDGFSADARRDVFSTAATPQRGERSCLVCLDLSDEALIAVLSSAYALHMQAAYIQHVASESLDTVESVEQRAFGLGYRKHPAYHRLFGYAELEHTSREIATLLEPVPAMAAAQFPMARMLETHALHMDMLREAGRRSDAHVVRYDWASKFIRPNDVVLDAACGTGYGTHVMRCLSPASRFHGIDASEWAIDYAGACFADDNAEFVAGLLPDALSSFEDASIDVIVAFGTLELDAFWRVLRPGGRILVCVPNEHSEATGKGPMHTLVQLANVLGTRFTNEKFSRQAAIGSQRQIEPVELDAAPHVTAEWWLAVALKSPEAGRALSYQETVHGQFNGTTHLVDFAPYYRNPWLVHAMVEMPYRLQRTDALKQLAVQVRAEYPLDSADHGAALAVICYRALDEHAGDEQLAQLDVQIAKYLALASDNPHIRRWQVSLAYVRARLRLRRGERAGALADFAAVAKADVERITPTLGTKTVDAAFRAGLLSWLCGDKANARDWWQRGLQSAGYLLGSGWPEFVGNPEAPFIFAMNDAVEMVDRATACAQALALTHRQDSACEAGLEEIGRTSLRAGLRQCEADLVLARDDALALREEFRRVCKELDAEGAQKAKLEQTAKSRLARIHELEAQLVGTQEAFADANKSAYERLDEIMALEARIRRTDAALDEARSLAVQRLQERTTLSARLDQAQGSLDETMALSVHRLDLVHGLELRLRDTDAALEQVKAQSVQRLHDNMRLEERIRQTDAALDEVKQLAFARLAHIHALEQELNVARLAATGPHAIAAPPAARCPDADSSLCAASTPDPEL